MRQGTVPIDVDELAALGIASVGVDAPDPRSVRLTEQALQHALYEITGHTFAAPA